MYAFASVFAWAGLYAVGVGGRKMFTRRQKLLWERRTTQGRKEIKIYDAGAQSLNTKGFWEWKNSLVVVDIPRLQYPCDEVVARPYRNIRGRLQLGLCE